MLIIRLFLSFFKVGLLGFGGGLAIVRLIYDSIQPPRHESGDLR